MANHVGETAALRCWF